MLTILLLAACVSDEEQAERDALWVAFQDECTVNGAAEAARTELASCAHTYNWGGMCDSYKARETAVAESNARIESLIVRRKEMEKNTWIAPVVWRCVDGLAYGRYVVGSW